MKHYKLNIYIYIYIYIYYIYKLFKSIYENEKNTVIKFDDIEIQKQKFYQHKRPFSIKNVNFHKICI